jgi:ATP-dependent Lon protease
VLVDHVDDVLREALIVSDPDKLFGPSHGVVEYRNGELFSESAPGTERPASAPLTIPGATVPGSVPPVSGPPDGRPAAE